MCDRDQQDSRHQKQNGSTTGTAPEGKSDGQGTEDQLAAVPRLEEHPVELRGVDPQQAALLGIHVAGNKSGMCRQLRIACQKVCDPSEVLRHDRAQDHRAAQPNPEHEVQQGGRFHVTDS